MSRKRKQDEEEEELVSLPEDDDGEEEEEYVPFSTLHLIPSCFVAFLLPPLTFGARFQLPNRAFPSRCAIRCAAPMYARRAVVACNVMGCDHGHGRSRLHARLEVPWSR